MRDESNQTCNRDATESIRRFAHPNETLSPVSLSLSPRCLATHFCPLKKKSFISVTQSYVCVAHSNDELGEPERTHTQPVKAPSQKKQLNRQHAHDPPIDAIILLPVPGVWFMRIDKGHSSSSRMYSLGGSLLPPLLLLPVC